MKARLPTLLKIAITFLLLVLLFYHVDMSEVWAALRRASVAPFLVAMVIYMGAVANNAIKWGILLRAQGVCVPLSSLLRHTFVGVFFNNFLPIIGADVVRGYGMARETANNANVAMSVVVDRVVGLLVFASAGTIAAWAALLGAGSRESALSTVAQAGLVATTALVIAFALMLSGRMRRLAERIVGIIPLLRPLLPLVTKLSTAVSAFRQRPSALCAAFAMGLVTIGLSNVANWLLFGAIEQPVHFLHVSTVNPIIGLLVALPISIGGLGVNQSAFPWLYGLFGVPAAPAVAVSFLMQLIIVLTSLPGGLLWMTTREQRAFTPSEAQPRE